MASITRTLGTKSLHSISFTGLSVWGKQILMAALIMTGLGIAISFPTPMRQRLSQQFLRLQQNPDIHPAMTKSDEGQQECDKCIAHEKLLAQKILNWASIHHTLPNAERWWQEVGVSGELLTCPTAPHTPVAYGLNPSLSGKSIKSAGNDPVHTVLLIEGHYEDNNLFLFDFRHPDKRMVVAFLDGHVDMLTAKQLTEAVKSTKSGWQDRITPGFNFVSGIGSVPVDHGFAVTCSIIRNVKLASLTTYISLDHEGENPIRTIPITVVPSQQTYTISWDGHDEQGHQMPPGIYWMNIVAETPDGKLGVEPLRFRLH